MELSEIVERMAQGLRFVDDNSQTLNGANPATSDYGWYLRGVGCLGEHQFRDELGEWWNNNFDDFHFSMEIKYPENGRWKCDICLTPFDRNTGLKIDGVTEWAIELKYIRFIGDNGKVNNFGLGKVVSPYKAEHSSVGDALRLTNTTMSVRKAVIMYGFEFDSDSVQNCRDILESLGLTDERAVQMEKTIRSGTRDGIWDLDPVAPIYEAACTSMNLELGGREMLAFDGLSRHPNYRKGKFLAWEVL